MAGSRQPGPMCLSRGHAKPDRGTSSRQRSPVPGVVKANQNSKSESTAPLLNKSMTLSEDGIKFLYYREYQKGVSNKLHWPKGASGVTLGPGYDMRHRSAAEVEKDLMAVGVDAKLAKTASAGAGKSTADAEKFAKDNLNLLVLTEAQEKALLRKTVESYEDTVRKHVKVTLNQNQYDALVSLVYNIGGANFKASKLLQKLNQGDYKGAAEEFLKWNKSGGKVMDGLTKRRRLERDLFLKSIDVLWDRLDWPIGAERTMLA